MDIFTLEAMHGVSANHVCDVVGERRGVLLTKGTACAFLNMQKAAMKDGLELHIASGFRDFARQNLIYSDKFEGRRVVLDKNERPLDIVAMTTEQKIRAILYFSAIPGLSRHHWGTDIDVYASNLLVKNEELDLTNKIYADGAQSRLTKWLDKFMGDFGFFRPYAQAGVIAKELWHLSFAQEADIFLSLLDVDEAVNFCQQKKILGGSDLEYIIRTEFDARFMIGYKF